VAIAVSAAREAILGRIRAATVDVPAGEDPAWRSDPPPRRDPDPARALRFVECLRDYGAEVTCVEEPEVGAAVAAALRRHGAEVAAAPSALPGGWSPAAADAGLELVYDEPPLDHLALERLGAAVTGCSLAIAETGSIVLAGGPAGRRALTLLPDLHVCVVRAAEIVPDVPDAIAALATERQPIVFVSGPSATSDIELERVEGVHGPRRLEVVLIEPREQNRD
jgi:L-lactate dehydrogenase complex protein LldG